MEKDNDDFGLNTSKPEKGYFCTLDEILSMPPPQWLVHGLIPQRGVGILYGESGSLKSFFALHLAACCAMGCNAFSEMPCKKADAFYIAAEGPAGFRLRTEAWIKYFTMKPDRLFISPRSIYIDREGVVESLIEEINSFPPSSEQRLVVIDTLSANFLGRENTDEMAGFLRNCQKISNSCNATVLVVHHTGKSEKQEERGHYSIRANADFSIRMKKSQRGEIIIEVQKFKDAAIRDALYLLQVQVEVAPGTDFPNSLVLVEDTGFEEELHEDIIKAYDFALALRDGATQKDLRTKVMDEFIINETRANRWIREILPDNKDIEYKGHLIRREGSGRHERILRVRKKDEKRPDIADVSDVKN